MSQGDVTATERPLRRDAERNRRLILTAARELFAERGLDASFKAIGREAGVGAGTLYRHFPTRDSLIEALFADGLETISRIADESLAVPRAWDGLRHFMKSMLELQAHDRGLRDIIMHVRKTREPGRRFMHTRLTAPLTVLVARAQQEGDLRTDLTAVDVAVLHIGVLGTADLTGCALPGGWQRYLAIVLDGMRAHPGSPTELPAGPLDEEQLDKALANWNFGIPRTPSAHPEAVRAEPSAAPSAASDAQE